MPTIYIIAGCNGAGKTTASYAILPKMLNCREFVNADSIAVGISPFQSEKVAFEAGRVMLKRINQLIQKKVNFAFETTLTTKSYVQKIIKCKKIGYEIILVYFWLNSSELAIKRIKERVKKGGHNIPDNIVRRRYKGGLQNLFKKFIQLSDYWFIIDNSKTTPALIAEGNKIYEKFVYNNEIWTKIKSSYK